MRRNYALFLALFAVFLIFLILASNYNVITLEGDNISKTFFVKDNAKVKLEFIHSVERFKYIEIYEVFDGKLILREVLCKSAGWGLPYYGEITHEDDYIVYHLNKTFRSFYVSVYPSNNYTIYVDGNEFRLDDVDCILLIRVDDLWQWTFQRLKESLHMKEG